MTLGKIVRWHKLWVEGADMRAACVNEINEFAKDMRNAKA